MSDNLDNYAAVDALPSFPLFPWFFVIPGVLIVGFAVLAGMWPLHTWSPVGHVAAPTAVSMLHAGVLMKLGAYGILRVAMTLLPEGARFWLPAVAALAIVNIVYGSIGAVAQKVAGLADGPVLLVQG